MAVGDSVQVNEGTGKRLATGATYTENALTVRDEKFILGEPYLASYMIATSGISTATANDHLVQIMAGSANKIRIRRIDAYLSAVATTATIMPMALFRLSTAGTGGGVGSIVLMDPAEAAATATVMTLPTAKGTEGSAPFGSRIYMMQTIAASAPLASPLLVWDFDRPRFKPLIIAAGTANGIAIKNQTAVAGAQLMFNIWFDEVPF